MTKRKRFEEDFCGASSTKAAKKARLREQVRNKVERARAKNDNPPRASLLGLPGELRNEIFRLVLVEPSRIEVDCKKRRLEPGLLRCCRGIRKEAKQIFRAENTFQVTVRYCCAGSNSKHWAMKAATRSRIYGARLVKLRGKPSWSALKRWVKAYHAGKMIGYPNSPVFTRVPAAVAAAFDLAHALPSARWEEVDAALEVMGEAIERHEVRKVFSA